MKIIIFWFKFYINLFPGVQLNDNADYSGDGTRTGTSVYNYLHESIVNIE